MKKIIYVVSNFTSSEYYGVNLDDQIIFTTDHNQALHFESEDEILAYTNGSFSFPFDCKIDSFIVNN